MHHRHEILSDRPLIGVSSKISFLFAEYESRVFYWEVIETVKKLVLTGFMALLPFKHDLMRLFMAIIFSFVVLMMQVLIKPYKTPMDNLLGDVSAMMLVLVFMGTYALQTDEADEDFILYVTMSAMLVIGPIFTLHMLLPAGVSTARNKVGPTGGPTRATAVVSDDEVRA